MYVYVLVSNRKVISVMNINFYSYKALGELLCSHLVHVRHDNCTVHNGAFHSRLNVHLNAQHSIPINKLRYINVLLRC